MFCTVRTCICMYGRKKQTKETEKKKEKRMKNPRERKYTCTSSNNKRRAKTEKRAGNRGRGSCKKTLYYLCEGLIENSAFQGHCL